MTRRATLIGGLAIVGCVALIWLIVTNPFQRDVDLLSKYLTPHPLIRHENCPEGISDVQLVARSCYRVAAKDVQTVLAYLEMQYDLPAPKAAGQEFWGSQGSFELNDTQRQDFSHLDHPEWIRGAIWFGSNAHPENYSGDPDDLDPHIVILPLGAEDAYITVELLMI